MDAQTQAANIAKLDVRLVQLFTEYRVSPEVMALCGHAGVDSVSTLAHLADDKSLFRAAFTLTVGLEPNTGPKAVQMSHVVGAYSAACIREEVDIRTSAERESNFMPVRSGDQERLNNRQTFDKVEDYELQDEAAPGQPYYDRKKAELKSVFTAEPLTMVTTVLQADFAAVQIPQVDTNGFLKVTTKEYAVPWPRDEGELRCRLFTLGVWELPKIPSTEQPRPEVH